MPRKKKLRSAEEILGIAKPLKSAEEILGIAPAPRKSVEELLGLPQPRKRSAVEIFESEMSQGRKPSAVEIFERELAQNPAPAPAPAEPQVGFFEGLYSDYASAVQRAVIDPGAAIIDAVARATVGDFNPIIEGAERLGRGAIQTGAILNAGPYAAPVAAFTDPTGQNPRIEELRRRAQAREPETLRLMREGARVEAAKPRTTAGKVGGVVGSVLGAAGPGIATAVATGGSVPALAGVAALQSAAEPENLLTNVALASVPVPSVAPILRRIRGVKDVAEEAVQAVARRGQGGTQIINLQGRSPALSRAIAEETLPVARPLPSPRTRAELEATPEFKTYFAGSQVVNQTGKPRIVYHGTAAADFPAFKSEGFSSVASGYGNYFTESAEIASTYASKQGAGARVIPVYLSIKRPLVHDAPAPDDLIQAARQLGVEVAEGARAGRVYGDIRHKLQESLGGIEAPVEAQRVATGVLKELGYDGIVYQSGTAKNPALDWVAFYPEQIKSATGNKGAFNRASGLLTDVDESGIYRAPSSLPALEAAEPSFGVRAASTRAPMTSGPRLTEMGFAEGSTRLNPNLVQPEERTPILEVISALRKSGLLGPKTHLRNVGGSGVFALGDEVARIPASIMDLVISPITKRRTITGPSFGAIGRSASLAARKGLKEAKEVIKNGATAEELAKQELKEINSGSKILDYYINLNFRVLNIEDRFARIYATRRALEDRARSIALTEIRSKELVRGDYAKRVRELTANPPEDLAAAAATDAEVAVFTEENRLVRGFNKFKEELPDYGKFGVDLIFPFVKTPTNIVKRMLEYSPAGFGRNAIQVARAITKRSFTDAEQRAFAQTFGRATVGSGIIALGAHLYSKGLITGLPEDDPGRRARDEAAGRIPGAFYNPLSNTWHQYLGFAPLGNLLAIGATIQREADQDREDSALGAVAETAASAIGEQPLLIGAKQIAESLKAPGSTGERLLGGLAGSFVPTILSDTAEAIDPEQRQMRSFEDRVLKRIPGARNFLPEAVDVLGQPRQDTGPVGAFLDPTRTTEAVETRNPLLAELVRLDQGISGFEKKADESEEDYAARIQLLGQLYGKYGMALISNPQYQDADKATRKEAFDILNRRAKTLISEGREDRAFVLLDAPNIFQAIRDKEFKQAQQRQQRR